MTQMFQLLVMKSSMETLRLREQLSFDQTDEQISLEALNEKVNKRYDFCAQG